MGGVIFDFDSEEREIDVTWKFIDEVLEDRELHQIPFHSLRPDESEYEILLMQHRGIVDAGCDGVMQADRVAAVARMASFFALAADTQPDIALTPEYACPWSVLHNLVQGNKWPTEGKLWIVGCESILPEQLEAFCDEHNELAWLYELPVAEMEQSFLTAVCFLFLARTQDGQNRRVAVLQFKQKPMADHVHEIEVKYMMRGSHRIIFRNHDQSIHLAVIICAEALGFNFGTDIPQSSVLPYLLLNPQLNPDPSHSQFREYRDFWSNRRMERMEILALNWARGTTVLGKTFKRGGSGWFLKSNSVDASDIRVNNAHLHGFYYTECQDRHYHCCILNYEECVLRIRSLKVFQADAAAAAYRKRVGPAVVASFVWNESGATWLQSDDMNGGFDQCCREIGADLSPLTDNALAVVDKERLVCLTGGTIKPSSSHLWPHIRSLESFEMRPDEVCQRVTFCHDPDETSCERRREWLYRFATLKNEILGGNLPLPQHLRALQGSGEIRYPAIPEGYSFNVVDTDGEFPSTFVFIGAASERHARQVMDRISDIVSDAKRSLVVWFREHSGQIRYVYPDGLDTFDANLSESNRSILRGTLT